MTKKVIILFVATLMSVASVFAQGGTTGPLTWQLTGTAPNFTLTISGEGEMPDYDINYDLPPWYEYRESIIAVVIENGVVTIGAQAFYYCNALSVTIPNSVTTIGNGAFRACEALTSITLPKMLLLW